MGYRRNKTIYNLEFEDHPGLEVRAHAASVGYMLRIGQLAGRRAEDVSDEDLEFFFTGFAKQLVTWNLEDDDGRPVPADLDGIKSQDLPFMWEILEGWIDATSGVAAPLGESSSSGKPSLEASLPMEPLSPSRAS